MEKKRPCINRVLFAIIGFCFALSCTELSDEDLALDYEGLQPKATDVYVMAVGDEFPVYEPKFVEPLVSPMVIAAGEAIRDVYYDGSDVAELQAIIDADRSSSASGDLLYVHLRGVLEVHDKPLVLASKTVLMFEGGSTGVVAADDATSSALLQVKSGSVNVGIMNKSNDKEAILLNGREKGEIKGIDVINGSRVHIDQMIIADCCYGIYYDGTGTGRTNQPGVITRCKITSNNDYANTGIRVFDASQPVIVDNEITVTGTPDAACVGIFVSASSSTVHLNRCNNCRTGIQMDPKSNQNPYCVITRNDLQNNTDSGIKLSGNSKALVITENNIHDNAVGIKVNGSSNHIFNNKFANTQNIKAESGNNNLIARNDDLDFDDLRASGAGTIYFNPPSVSNPHTDQVYFNKARVDITVNQEGDEPKDLAEVQAILDNFDKVTNAANNKYLVLTMNGDFIAHGIPDRANPYTGGYAGLIVPGWVTVILNGSMVPEGKNMYMFEDDGKYGKGDGASSGPDVGYGGTSLVLFPTTEPGSMSGGTVDCRGYREGNYHSLPTYAIYAPKDNLLILDHVKMMGASQNQLGLLHHDGINTPVFVYDCDFDGCVTSNSCIWSHMCSFNYHIGNRGYNTELGNFSGLDAGGSDSYVLFNYTCDVGRCGCFMEEGASHNYVMGNYFNGSKAKGNGRYGVGMYNSGGKIAQDGNMILMNKTEGTLSGIKIQHSKNQFMFNNITLSGEFHIAGNCQSVYSSCDIFGTNFTWLQPSGGASYANTFFSLPY